MDSWLNIQKSINALQETFSVRMNAELPWTLAGWLGVILRAIVLILPLHGLIFVSRRMSRKWPESLRTGWTKMCGHSFVWLSFGFTFHFAAWSPSGSYHVLSIIGTLLLSLGRWRLHGTCIHSSGAISIALAAVAVVHPFARRASPPVFQFARPDSRRHLAADVARHSVA
ncbi:MAG: hypothetical protein ACLRWP_07400 [Bilophila wadsworthia]